MKTSMVLVFATILLLSSQKLQVESHPVVDCLKYVKVKECRGLAMKRDTTARINEDYNRPDDQDLNNSNLPINDLMLNRLLFALLRKNEKPLDYDMAYLK